MTALRKDLVDEARTIIESIPKTDRQDFILSTKGKRGGCILDPHTYCKGEEMAKLLLEYVDFRIALSGDQSDLLIGSWYGKGWIPNIDHIGGQHTKRRRKIYVYG